MKTLLNRLATRIALAWLGLMLAVSALAQPQPNNFVQRFSLASAVTATGAQPSARGVNVGKSYQVTGLTSSGTGSAVVKIQGSNDNATWDDVGTVTLTLGTGATSGSFTSLDRYMFLRANATTLTGTGAQYSATVGY